MSVTKTCLVTGATSGIGRSTALGLARQGAHVLIVGRDAERAKSTVDWIVRETGNNRVEMLLADLSSLAEVHALAMAVRQKCDRLDVLVNNAGTMFTERVMTADGFERTWALNHLAYAALALDLLPLLTSSAPARIVNVTSAMHKQSTIAFDNLQGERGFSGMRAYSQSKLAIVMFTYALASRLVGTGVTVNCLHPGLVATGGGRDLKGAMKYLQLLLRPFQISPDRGAATSIYLASAPEVEGVSGQYFVQCKAAPSSTASHDPALQTRLWQTTLGQLGDVDPSHS